MANPNIVIKTGDIGPIKRVLTVAERESLQKAADVYGYGSRAGEFTPGPIAGPVDMPGLNVKRARLNEQQKRVLDTLREQSPEPIKADDRDKFNSHAEKLASQFKPFLQTQEELRSRNHRDPAFNNALKKARAWTTPLPELGGRTPAQVAEDYRNIKKRLEPDNPEADSLEHLREKR